MLEDIAVLTGGKVISEEVGLKLENTDLAMRRSIAFSTSWWQVFLLSFLQVGLLIHIMVSFLPPDKVKYLAPLTKNIFANPDLHLWWLVLPMAAIIVLRRFEAQED